MQLRARAQYQQLPSGKRVFEPGGRCQSYLLVVSGSVRVELLTEGGREAVLYHVRAGESCVLTTSCLLGDSAYPAYGVCETDVTALAIPLDTFNHALESSGDFRRFVFASLGRRFAEVIARIEQIAFSPIDRRLAALLLSKCAKDGSIKTTHQALANELGSAREVVSRHLKRFERMGWLRLQRGSITVLQPQPLQDIVQVIV